MMKNAFYFMLKALSVLKVFGVLFWLYKKVKIYFKFYDVIDCKANNCNTRIAQHLKKKRQ